MKHLVILAVFSVALGQLKKCQQQSDCGGNECCVLYLTENKTLCDRRPTVDMNVTINVTDNSTNQAAKYSWNIQDVEEFRKLVESEKNVISRLDDDFLLSCLRARKFDSRRALELVKNHYASKRKYPHLFQTFNTPSIQECLDANIVGYLPGSDHLGRLITIFKLNRWDPTKIALKDIISASMLFGDLVLNSHLVQVNGILVLLDISGLSIEYMLQLTPRMVYQIMQAAAGTHPLSYREVHCVNISSLFYPVFSMILPFIPHKIRKRIYLHANVDSLQKHIPKRYLPSDFGGELEITDFTHCNRELRNHEEFFRENEKYG